MHPQHTDFSADVNRLSPPRKAPRVSPSQRTPFLMLFGDDFLSGCRKSAMTPEQVGMYIVMLILEWTDKAPLDDDMKRLSVRSGWDVRIVRRLINELVTLKKYDREEGHLSNARMQHEIAIYVEKAKAKEARKGNTSRADVRQMPGISATATQQLADSCERANEDLSEKTNENNEGFEKTQRYTRARQTQNQNQKQEETSPNGEVVSVPALALDDARVSAREVSALEAFNAYNDLALELALPVCGTLTPGRRKSLMARLREHGGMAAWDKALANIGRSAFLRGQVKDFQVNFDWLIKPANFGKVVDGTYGNGAHAKEGELDKLDRLVRQAYDHQQHKQLVRLTP